MAEPAAAVDPIAHAARVFRLTPLDRDAVTLLFGVATGTIGSGRASEVPARELGVALGADLGRVARALSPGGSLRRHALVTLRGDGPILDRRVALDDDFWPRLADVPVELPAPLLDMEPVALDDLALTPELRARAEAARTWLAGKPRLWPTLVVRGPAGTGRAALARALADAAGLATVAARGAELTPAAVPGVRRELAWHQATALITDADRADRGALAEIAAEPGPLVVTCTASLADALLVDDRAVYEVELPPLTDLARAAIWRHHLARAEVAAHELDVDYLAARFPLSPARIQRAARALAGRGEPVRTDDAVALCRSLPDVAVGGLAERLPLPYRWPDLIVSQAVRRELELVVTWARHGARLFAPGGPGGRARAGRGLACLLHGPPGTGKTLAAQVVAAELGLDLYRVDLSQVVDKYIGETEKRLDLVFREAEAAGAILFFDEADALFARRTDVKDARDRYANLEAGFLLQRLEGHGGLVLLASNLQKNLDPAFHRRLACVVEVPPPGQDERRRIWDRLLPPAELRAGDIDTDLLSVHPLTGGDIRNAVIAAVLLSAREGEALGMAHLALAVARELRKAGRMIDPDELGPWGPLVIRRLTEADP